MLDQVVRAVDPVLVLEIFKPLCELFDLIHGRRAQEVVDAFVLGLNDDALCARASEHVVVEVELILQARAVVHPQLPDLAFCVWVRPLPVSA